MSSAPLVPTSVAAAAKKRGVAVRAAPTWQVDEYEMEQEKRALLELEMLLDPANADLLVVVGASRLVKLQQPTYRRVLSAAKRQEFLASIEPRGTWSAKSDAVDARLCTFKSAFAKLKSEALLVPAADRTPRQRWLAGFAIGENREEASELIRTNGGYDFR
jgi:hypothetical protein